MSLFVSPINLLHVYCCLHLRSRQRKMRCPQKNILVARVFLLQRQVIYQIKAKRLNYLIKDFISSNFKRHLSFCSRTQRYRVYC